MSFSDPQSITISGVTTPLPRTSSGEDEGEYTSGDGLLQLLCFHKYGKRVRRELRVNVSKLTPDPFKPAENVRVSMSVYTVFDLPPAGFTVAEATAAWVGFNTLQTASSNALIGKVLGGES